MYCYNQEPAIWFFLVAVLLLYLEAENDKFVEFMQYALIAVVFFVVLLRILGFSWNYCEVVF